MPRPVLVLVLAGLAVPATSAEPGASFVAREACEAFQSKNRQTNPGDVRVEPGQAYDLVEGRATGGYVRIRVPGAPGVAERWVLADCGSVRNAAGSGESTDNVLALSWQPAFCETRPTVPECRQLNAGELPAAETRLSVHGLWPQPENRSYCAVPARLVSLDEASRWSDLPSVEVDGETGDRLRVAMPGAASFLERHEWLKHGTCYLATGGAEEYFGDMLVLATAVNGSAVGALLARRVGGTLQAADIRAAFDAAFGPGAGTRVKVHCADDGSRTLIQELTVNLRGTITPETPLGELMLAADPVSPGCPKGVIDPAGLQ